MRHRVIAIQACRPERLVTLVKTKDLNNDSFRDEASYDHPKDDLP